MSGDIDDLLQGAETRLASLRIVKEKYPDARPGSIFGKPIIASELALKDAFDVMLFVGEKEEVLLLSYVQVGTVAVLGWGPSAAWTPAGVILNEFRKLDPNGFSRLLDICRRCASI